MHPLIAFAAITYFVSQSYASNCSLEIEPTHVTKAGASIKLGADNPEFYVVIRNTSSTPMKVWKEWCSWGWYNMSFQIERAKGKSFKITKGRHIWTWNFPDSAIILPHESFVWPVTFNDDWDLPAGFDSSDPVRLTAIFQNGA